jgi:transcriptional regulator with GAF, ATPase, and Fis domain
MKRVSVEKAKKAIIGPSLDKLKELVLELAKREKHTLFVGETGTGKELLARLFLAGLPSARGCTFEARNCAAFPNDDLLYSELFGHVKGAFTGANQERAGVISTCDKGALFLDELGHAQSRVQVSLLRYLQTKDYTPLGVDKSKIADVCIVAAASGEKTLSTEMKMRFQTVYVPGLPLRNNDIFPLIKHFLMKNNVEKITKEALDLLERRRYSGHVRELEHIVERSALLASQDRAKILTKEHVPPGGSLRTKIETERIKPDSIIHVPEISAGDEVDPIPMERFSIRFVDPEERSIKKLLNLAERSIELEPARMIADPLSKITDALAEDQIDLPSMSRDEMMKMYLKALLKKTGGNQAKAAEIADMNPHSFRSLLKKYKLRPKD